ncbi:7779_t:CDS:2, partial [Acaulospora morrowiae]
FIANFTYDDTNEFIVNFTEEPGDPADEATKYLLISYNKTKKERDVFQINFADSISTTKFQKTDIEDVEIEIDNEGKPITILFRNASIKMANILK